jgi:nitroreductase
MEQGVLEAIRTRRSVRKFTPEPVDEETLLEIVEMGAWAPSGLNNQPWRFVLVGDPATREGLSRLTRYSHIIRGAPACVAVFLDNGESYDRVKDIQAVGACIQNMLLAIHCLGLGGVWLGEILKNRESVERLLCVPEAWELMAVVALGRPAETGLEGNRKPLRELILPPKGKDFRPGHND